jgi:Arf-GAP with coiled-coil, ANK repeat and PH domain-containing protein
VRNVKETRRHFEKMSTDMDNALVRNAQVARNKTQECDDSYNYLTAMTSGFYHTALDYVFQVSELYVISGVSDLLTVHILL